MAAHNVDASVNRSVMSLILSLFEARLTGPHFPNSIAEPWKKSRGRGKGSFSDWGTRHNWALAPPGAFVAGCVGGVTTS